MNSGRYNRQIILRNFGEEAQTRLQNSKILVAGAGGLGCPALIYLAAAGAGTICIADYDKVDLSNIQRQVLYKESDCGQPKADTAAKNLRLMNSEISIVVFDSKITNLNAIELISEYDVVIDCTDNFESRYIINDACCIVDKPLIYGAVLGFEGQVGVFNFSTGDNVCKTNYRDLFPEPPEPSSVFSCNDSGVLGVVPGVIGTLQAAEAIKIVTKSGTSLSGRLISYNSFTGSFYEFKVTPSPERINKPLNKKEFKKFDYSGFCSLAKSEIREILAEDFISMTGSGKYEIIDVREEHEPLDMSKFGAVRIPLSRFIDCSKDDFVGKNYVIVCETGERSRRAVDKLQSLIKDVNAFSLKGGARALRNYIPTKSQT